MAIALGPYPPLTPASMDSRRHGLDSAIWLLKALLAGERDAVARRVLARQLDMAQLAAFLEREHMALYARSLLEAQRLLNLFPAAFRDSLQRQTEQQRLRRAGLSRAMVQLQAGLRARGVTCMVLKGLPFADRYWGGVDCRFVWDLDLLVHAADRQSAMATLQQQGFTAPPWQLRSSALAFRLLHALEFTGPAVAVDLHWCFRRRPGIRIDYREVWRDAQTRRLDEYECLVPGRADTLLILLLGLAQDAERGRISMRKLWDIYLWLRAEGDFDWPGFFDTCGRRGVASICLNMLRFTLLALDGTEEFPALAEQFRAHPALLRCDRAQVGRLLERPRLHPGNRLWIARLQSVPAWYYLLWWTATSPLRYFFGRSL